MKREEPASSLPLVLEGFTPIGESLEWRVGQAYWAQRGSGAFHAGEVPHLITNDGMHAARSADVLFASCEAAARTGRLEDEIAVAELGVGLGLHARLFLDRFRARCAEAGTDFYRRLVFHATDRSPRMLSDLAAAGTLAEHGERVRLGRLDAAAPGALTPLGSEGQVPLGGLRAVFHNYLMDALPFDVVLPSGGGWLRLHLRVSLADAEAARRRLGGMDPASLVALAIGGDEEAVQRLRPVYERFDVEKAYLPVDPGRLPFREILPSFAEAVRAARPPGHPAGAYDDGFVHSHGALASLTATARVLRPDGFVLMSDYGRTGFGGTMVEHQRYGGSRAMGINFALLDHGLDARRGGPFHVATPEGDERGSIHTRLLTVEPLPEVVHAFRQSFAQEQFEAVARTLEQAHAARDRGDLEAAQALYAEAHQQAPENWYVLVDWCEFANFGLRDPDLALKLGEQALAMNPTASPLAYNTYGDALYEADRRDEALEAYRQALRIHPDDVRGHANVAWVLADQGEFREAILELSTALANDESGKRRQSLVTKLLEVLDRRDGTTPGQGARPPGPGGPGGRP